MRVLFMYSVERGSGLATPLGSLGAMQFGISYISAVLKQAGMATSLMVLSSESERAWPWHVSLWELLRLYIDDEDE
jgi:hypothetical protein